MILKCKMCGGDIQISGELTHGTCDSCGTVTTLPILKKENSEQKANSYNRANHFRLQNDFDKALSIYEKLIEEDSKDAEAHWCAVLCRFGIEYVTDPISKKRVPTCHRASYDSILKDVDYLATIQNTQDEYTKSLYQQEAIYIVEVQKNILTISQNETPYEVFICYKETDSSGNRTVDSTIAQDIYYQLQQSGYKVFFSKITLEDKLGQAYEPYIFSALNSAKVMLCIGTKPEYFSAVWVKNEWSRYLTLMKNDRSRSLIPCYRDMDAYDIPDELAILQSQDMSKIGFLQDLIRGIQKVLNTEKTQVLDVSVSQLVHPTETTDTVAPLLTRIEMFLEEKNWENVVTYCGKVLDIAPHTGVAYVYLLCAKYKHQNLEGLSFEESDIRATHDFKNASRFLDGKTKEEFYKFTEIYEKNQKIYNFNRTYSAIWNKVETIIYGVLEESKDGKEVESISHPFILQCIVALQESKQLHELAVDCSESKLKLTKVEEIEEKCTTFLYRQGITLKANNNYEMAEKIFSQLSDFLDSLQLLEECKEYNDRIQKEKKEIPNLQNMQLKIKEESAEANRKLSVIAETHINAGNIHLRIMATISLVISSALMYYTDITMLLFPIFFLAGMFLVAFIIDIISKDQQTVYRNTRSDLLLTIESLKNQSDELEKEIKHLQEL